MLPNRVISQPPDYSHTSLFAAQSIANAAIVQVINLSPLSEDGLAFNPIADNIPIGDRGLYSFEIHANFAANITGQRRIYLFKNGVQLRGQVEPANNTAAAAHLISGSFVDIPNPGDVYDVRVFQSSGAALNLNECRLTVIRVRDI